jgi:hypothetical protein
MRPITLLTIIAFATLFIQCKWTTNKTVQTSNSNWTKDKNGCMHIRDEKLANTLLSDNGLMNNSKEAFLKVFDSPNETVREIGTEILIYYWSTVCDGNKIIADGDKCYARFYFKEDKLVSTDFPCE